MKHAKSLSERSLTLSYLAALGLIASLTLASHVTLNRVLREHEGSAEIVNTSGRQRMLSQRIASLAAQYRLGSPTAKADLLAAVAQFESAHHKLLADSTSETHSGPSAATFRTIYFGGETPLDGEVATYLDLARRIAAQKPDAPETDPALDQLFREARSPLLKHLDEVVAHHQQDSEQQLTHLESLQRITLAVVLVTLLAEALMIFRPMVRQVTRYAREMMHLASTDGLTGLLNRASFLERSSQELARTYSAGQGAALLMIDADNFKIINDTFGHAGGDAALRAVAQSLANAARSRNLAGRLGGEEFALLLPNTTERVATIFAERLRAEIEQLAIPHSDRTIQLTVSIGIAASCADETPDLTALLRLADIALYESKAGGRNRVTGSAPRTPKLAWSAGELALAAQ